MKPLNICMIANSLPFFEIGGIETHVYELSKNLTERGHSVDLFIKSNKYTGDFTHENIDIHLIPCPPVHITIVEQIIWEIRFLRNYAKMLKNVDVVHAHGRYGAATALLKFLRRLGKPFIVTLHASMIAEAKSVLTQLKNAEIKHLLDAASSYPFLTILQKLTLNQTTGIIAVSSDNLRDLSRCYKVPSKKIEIIPNGIDTERFSPRQSKELKHRMGLCDKFVLLFVGNLTLRKGLHYAMKALADGRFRHNLKLLIVGDGPYKEKLRKLSVKLKIDKDIVFLGRVSAEDLLNYYSLADVFILPSVHEGLGISVLEAMACGKPVIASNTGGIPDIIINEKNGFLFKIGDTRELSVLIENLRNNGDLLAKVGCNARAFVQHKYDWKVIARKVEQLYAQVTCLYAYPSKRIKE